MSTTTKARALRWILPLLLVSGAGRVGATAPGASRGGDPDASRGPGPLGAGPRAQHFTAPRRAQSAPGAPFLLELGAGGSRGAFRVAFDGSELELGGRDGTRETLAIPAEARGGQVQWEWMKLAGGEFLLDLRFGGDSPYAVLLMGPESGAGGPTLLLKGFIGPQSPTQVELHVLEQNGRRRPLLVRPVEGLCGRKIWASTQALDPGQGRFVPVALPALAVEEQRGALALAAQAWGGDRSGVEPGDAAQASQEDASAARGRVELSFAPLSAAPASRRAPGPALFDGDREAVARPHAAAELPHAGLEVSSLLVHAAPAAAEGGAARRELWLAGEGKVYRVEASEVAPHTPWEIAIPEELRGACLAVVQGGVPWIAEVTGLGVEEHLSGLGAAALASRLGGQAGELAARALLAQGPDALGDLLAALRELSPQGRRRARQIAAVWGDDALAQVVVRQLMAGDELEQEGARSVLRELDASGRAALVSALGQARPREEVALASALAELAPDQAGGHLVQLLDHPSPARRLEIRRVLAGLAGRPQAQRHLGALLLDGSRTRRSRTELLRALTPFVDRLDASARGQAFAFLQTAGFHEAYRLVPVLLELSRTDPKAAQLGVERFVQNGAGYSALQRAALRRHLLQVGTDAEAPLPWLSPQAISLLTNSQVRVRRAAADYLAKFPVPAAAEVLIGRTRDDEWPEVRQRTVRALGVLRGRAEEKVEQTVLWSLRKDAEPVVRAAAARALDDMPTEATLSVLRRSLQKDESKIVRAEVARSLGQVCDRASLDALTRLANGLRQGAREEADVRVGLAAAAAVARMAPDEVEERLEPLFRSDVPGVLRARVEAAIEPGLGQCATESRQ